MGYRFRRPKDGLYEDMPDRSVCVCFTGHRSKNLKWGRNERDERCIALKRNLRAEIARLYNLGNRYFISGMAEGVDTFAAEAVLELQGELDDIRLICVFPYGYGNTSRIKRITNASYGVISLNNEYVTGCMAQRNRFMVEHSNSIVCVYAGDPRSGTAATMRMAQESGLGMTVMRI